MSSDDEILKAFGERLDDIKIAPPPLEISREDLIEKAKENFGSVFDFVTKLDATVKEKLGGGSVVLDFGDFDPQNRILSAWIVIEPPGRENLLLMLRFQGLQVRIEHPAFKRSSGSQTFVPADADQIKSMLADLVLSSMMKK